MWVGNAIKEVAANIDKIFLADKSFPCFTGFSGYNMGNPLMMEIAALKKYIFTFCFCD